MLIGESSNWLTTDLLLQPGLPTNARSGAGSLSVIGVGVDFDTGTVTLYRRRDSVSVPLQEVVMAASGLGAGTWFPFANGAQGTANTALALVTHAPSFFMALPAGFTAWDDTPLVPPSAFWTGFKIAEETLA